MNSVATETTVMLYRDKTSEELREIIASHSNQPGYLRRYDCRGLAACIVLDERKAQ